MRPAHGLFRTLRGSSSLRVWLQSSSLIAVLAGYALLLGSGRWVAQIERSQSHRQFVNGIAAELVGGDRAHASLKALRAFGVVAEILPKGTPIQAPRLIRWGQTTWLVSSIAVPPAGAQTATLLVRQDVTESIRREHTLQLQILAAAGFASLFTSALLRLVLRRGLVTPIDSFCQQLQCGTHPAHEAALIREDDQPRELRPIAAAFNERQVRLDAAWRRERIFTDAVAHELRTPITLISGHAQSLLRQDLEARQRRPVASIAAEADHMTKLIRDLLDLARQDGERLRMVCRTLDPEALMLEAFDRLRPLAPERLQLLADGGSHPPITVQADADRLLQCLSALVDNALAYSKGSVQLELRCAPRHVVWHVRDRGPGVAAEETDLIFERFVRGSAATGSNVRGSGLGLAVVRLLMDAMGGSVSVAPACGGGADFQLQLPVHVVSLSPPPPAAAD